MKKILTHFFNTTKPKKGFKPISFLVSDNKHLMKGIYFHGFDGKKKISRESIKGQIKHGGLIEFKQQIPIYEGEAVWLNASGYIFIGKKEDITDNNRNKLRKIADSRVLSTYAKTIAGKTLPKFNESVRAAQV